MCSTIMSGLPEVGGSNGGEAPVCGLDLNCLIGLLIQLPSSGRGNGDGYDSSHYPWWGQYRQ
jgi:hypothetical protein